MPKPKEINFGFIHVDEKTWDLNIEPEEMDIKELESNLNIAYLDKQGTDDWNLTPWQLIKEPEKEPGHYDKIKKADLKYPIKIYFFRGSWKILDGVHRLCKAIMEDKQTIMVCKVPPEMIPKIIN